MEYTLIGVGPENQSRNVGKRMLVVQLYSGTINTGSGRYEKNINGTNRGNGRRQQKHGF